MGTPSARSSCATSGHKAKRQCTGFLCSSWLPLVHLGFLFFGGAPRQGAEPPRVGLSVCLSVCLCVCVSVCNKKYFRSSALTQFRDLRFKTWPRKLCSATLTLSRTLEMTSRARPQDVSGFRDPAIANPDFGVEIPSSTRLQTLAGLGARVLLAVTATCQQQISNFPLQLRCTCHRIRLQQIA